MRTVIYLGAFGQCQTGMFVFLGYRIGDIGTLYGGCLYFVIICIADDNVVVTGCSGGCIG